MVASTPKPQAGIGNVKRVQGQRGVRSPPQVPPMTPWQTMILDEPAHHEVPIPHHTPEELATLGFTEDRGAPKGQVADFRKPLPDGRGLHIRAYKDRMTIHWDHVDPNVSKLGHLVKDTPWLVAGAAVVGMILGVGGVQRWRR